MKPHVSAAFVIACHLLLAGCGETEPIIQERSVVQDSAGIRIVTHDAAADLTLEPSAEPLVVFGGESDPLFRVTAGLLEGEQRILLVNAGSYQMRWYDLDGRLLGAHGGRGSGPGEFQRISSAQRVGDGRVAVNDGLLQRVTVLDSAGVVHGLFAADLGPRDPETDVFIRGAILWVSDDGRFIGIPSPIVRLEGRDREITVMGSVRLFSHEEGQQLDLADVRLALWRETPDPAASFAVRPVAGGAMLRSGADADRLVITSNDRHLLRVFDNAEESLRIIEERTLRPSSVDTLATEVDSLAAYGSLQVDAEGRIWAAPPTVAEDPVTPWRLFARDGRYVGTLPLPPRAAVLDARGDRVLILTYDEWDVETVRLLEVPALANREGVR